MSLHCRHVQLCDMSKSIPLVTPIYKRNTGGWTDAHNLYRGYNGYVPLRFGGTLLAEWEYEKRKSQPGNFFAEWVHVCFEGYC